MDQVEELLDIIEAHKMTGVNGASVMFSFFKRRVQPIQLRHKLGFEYAGLKILLACAQRNYQTKPHSSALPGLFCARSPPKPVSIRLLFVEDELCSAAAN
jgi:hypothetical protein